MRRSVKEWHCFTFPASHQVLRPSFPLLPFAQGLISSASVALDIGHPSTHFVADYRLILFGWHSPLPPVTALDLSPH
jgi:hypothetical protein